MTKTEFKITSMKSSYEDLIALDIGMGDDNWIQLNFTENGPRVNFMAIDYENDEDLTETVIELSPDEILTTFKEFFNQSPEESGMDTVAFHMTRSMFDAWTSYNAVMKDTEPIDVCWPEKYRSEANLGEFMPLYKMQESYLEMLDAYNATFFSGMMARLKF